MSHEPAAYLTRPQASFRSILELRTEYNLYFGEMVVIVSALETLLGFKYCRIAVVTRNKAAVLILRHPYQ